MEALCRCRCSKTPAWWGRVSVAVCACKAHARRSRRSATGPDWSRRTRSTESCRHALSDLGCGRLSFFSSPKLYSSNDSIGIHQCCRRSRAKGCGRRTRSFDAPEYNRSAEDHFARPLPCRGACQASACDVVERRARASRVSRAARRALSCFTSIRAACKLESGNRVFVLIDSEEPGKSNMYNWFRRVITSCGTAVSPRCSGGSIACHAKRRLT